MYKETVHRNICIEIVHRNMYCKCSIRLSSPRLRPLHAKHDLVKNNSVKKQLNL